MNEHTCEPVYRFEFMIDILSASCLNRNLLGDSCACSEFSEKGIDTSAFDISLFKLFKLYT